MAELEAAANEDGKVGKRRTSRSDSLGMFWSVECYEEAPFVIDKAQQEVKDIPTELSAPILRDVKHFYQVCKIWQVGDAPILEDKAVKSAIPTLIFAGQLDPITPPSWAQLAAKSLSNSFYFEAPRAGNGMTSYWDCPQKMMISFLNNPEANRMGVSAGRDHPFETK